MISNKKFKILLNTTVLSTIALIIQAVILHKVQTALPTPSRIEIKYGLKTKNPLWSTNCAPARGETKIEQTIRQHIAHHLTGFADTYAPTRSSELIKKIVFLNNGNIPTLKWLQWASKVAPFDYNIKRNEFFWTFQLVGPVKAINCIKEEMGEVPNGLVLVDAAWAYMNIGKPEAWTFAKRAFENKNKWLGWDIKDIAQLGLILDKGEKTTYNNKQFELASQLNKQKIETIQELEQRRKSAGLPEIHFGQHENNRSN